MKRLNQQGDGFIPGRNIGSGRKSESNHKDAANRDVVSDRDADINEDDFAENNDLPPPTARIWKSGWRRSVKIATKNIFQHPIEAFFLVIIYMILVGLKLDRASQFGGFVGRNIVRHFSISNRVRRNLSLAFPEKSTTEREELLIPIWDNLGRVMAEMPHLVEIAENRVAVNGAEFLIERAAKKAPTIIMMAHCSNWEIAPAWLSSLGVDAMAIYRPLNNKIANRLLIWTRRNSKFPMVAKGSGAARTIISRLKKGESVLLPIDQKLNTGIAVPFFGHPAMTTPFPAKLAYMFNAPMVLMLAERTQGTQFRMHISPPIWRDDFKADNEEATILALMTEANRQLEEWIRRYPDQWFWPHRRWPK